MGCDSKIIVMTTGVEILNKKELKTRILKIICLQPVKNVKCLFEQMVR